MAGLHRHRLRAYVRCQVLRRSRNWDARRKTWHQWDTSGTPVGHQWGTTGT